MTRDEFLQLLGLADPEGFIDSVIDVLQEVYRFNSDRHEPLMGDDEQVFGFAVYRNGWYRLEEVVAAIPGVWTSRPKNSLLIRTEGGVRFHVYRGGKDETYDVETYDFDGGTWTKRSLSLRNTQQLRLFETEDATEDHRSELVELVFVHSGNPESGLTGVWVGAPIAESDGSSPWAWVLQLWVPSETSPASTVDRPTAGVVAYDELAPPELVIEARTEDEGEGSTGDTAV